MLIKLLRKSFSKINIQLIQVFDLFSTGISTFLMSKYKEIPFVIRLGAIYELFYSEKIRSKLINKNYQIAVVSSKVITRLLNYWAQFLFKHSSFIVSNSQFLLNHYFRFEGHNAIVIPNTVNFNFIEKIIKLPPSEDFALFVGRIEPRKSVEMAILAYSNLFKENRPLKLIIIGNHNINPMYTKSLKILIKQCSLESHIEFIDHLDQFQLPDYYWNARYTIFCTNAINFPITEGLPNVIVESLSSGGLVVASNVAGVSEILFDKKNGFLYPAESLSTLISILKFLDNSKQLRLKVRNIAKQTALDLFQSKNISLKYAMVYRKVIQSHKKYNNRK